MRITVFQMIRITLMSVLFLCNAVAAQDNLQILQKWIKYADAENTLIKQLNSIAFHQIENRKMQIDQIATIEQWKVRQQQVGEVLEKIVGSFPEKTPLNAEITGVVIKPDFKIEHVVYQSMPGYYVTGSLFIPLNLKKKKAPAIIYCSGHANNGYRNYQNILINLVKKGFVVFAFDPVGQGERIEYFNFSERDSLLSSPTHQHSYPAAQYFLNGQSIARNFIWDGIRAVDFLFSRKEVDTSRIGMTGRSGGGTQAALIPAFDKRIKASATENYVVTYSTLLQSIGLQDGEQNFVSGIKDGIEITDFLIAQAPRPLLMITTSRDIFEIAGANDAAAEVQNAYKSLGAAQQFSVATDDAGHASTIKNREAMYVFFRNALLLPGNTNDEEVELLTEEALKVTRTGQVATTYDAEMAWEVNSREALEKEHALIAKRASAGFTDSLIGEAKRVSGFQNATTGEPVFMGRFNKGDYYIEKYKVETGRGYVLPYLLYRPLKAGGTGVIYLHPEGKLADTAQTTEMMHLVRNGVTVLVPDLSGIGELGKSRFRGDSFIDNNPYNVWFTAVMTGVSIAGIQAADISALCDVLEKDSSVTSIQALAKYEMVSALAHVAAFDNRISKVALLHPYLSYKSFVFNKYYNPKCLTSTIPNVIGRYDIPDLLGNAAPGGLLIINPTNANGVYTAEVEEDITLLKSINTRLAKHAPKVVRNAENKTINQLLLNWLKN